MNSLLKFFLTIFLLVILSSCQKWVAKALPARPDREMKFSDKDGASPEFKKGWEDGCEVGMSAGSNTFYQMFYRNNAVDGYKMTSSPDYKTAWGNAFWFCYRTDWIRQKSSIWGSTFGGYR